MLFFYFSILALFIMHLVLNGLQMFLLSYVRNSYFSTLFEKEITVLEKIRIFFRPNNAIGINTIIYNYIVCVFLIYATMFFIRYIYHKNNKNFNIKNLVLISMFVSLIVISSQLKSILPLTFFVYVMLSNFLPLYDGLLVVIINDFLAWALHGMSQFSFIWLYVQILTYVFIYYVLSYKINCFNITFTGVVFAVIKAILNVINTAMFTDLSLQFTVISMPSKMLDDIFAVIAICVFIRQIKAFIKRFASIKINNN